jgi:hypothetical protein
MTHDHDELVAADLWPVLEGHDSVADDRDNSSDMDENEDDPKLQRRALPELALIKALEWLGLEDVFLMFSS